MSAPRFFRVLAMGVAALTSVTLLGGCSLGPRHSPDDPGIPEARAAALTAIDDLVARLTFSAEVQMLGTGHADSCGSALSNGSDWDFGTRDLGYRCFMQWKGLAVVPGIRDREVLIAALESELAGIDVGVEPGGLLRDYIMLYPPQRAGMPIATGSRIGDLSFSLSTEPFRAGLWPGVRASGSVSRAGDVFDLTPEDVRVTGASHVIDLTISTEYWNTEGLEEYPAWTDESDGVPPGAAVKFWSYGDDDAYELVSLTPGFPDACTLDPAVDQASIQRSDEPFSRLRFRLTPGSDTIARQRVSDCLIPGLSRGTTLIIFDPFTEPGRS